jgi:integrase
VLRVAVRWKVLTVMPCAIDFYKVQNLPAPFYEFEEYERLIEAAGKIDTPTLVAILLGGDAGLRRGEIVALRRIEVDLRRRQPKVEVNDWKGIVDTPKSGSGRVVPLTETLFEALTKTMRYMHLSPSEHERAIGLLNSRGAHGAIAAHGGAAIATT